MKMVMKACQKFQRTTENLAMFQMFLERPIWGGDWEHMSKLKCLTS